MATFCSFPYSFPHLFSFISGRYEKDREKNHKSHKDNRLSTIVFYFSVFPGPPFRPVLKGTEDGIEMGLTWVLRSLSIGNGQVDMIQVIVHFYGLNPGPMMLFGNFPHLWKENGLDIRIPYAPAWMF